jgi:cephalosporin hydroxylase
MNEAAQIAPPQRILPAKVVYTAMAAYLPAAVAIALPAEKLTMGNSSYTLWLWYQYSGQAVLGVLAFMLLLQMIVWQRKKHWMIWPGILAGLHATAFATLRIVSLLQQKAPSGSLAETIHSSTSPMIGLYLLLIGGVVLLGVHGWVWRKK